MGIQGLLPLLSDIHETRHLSHFSGKTLAVDAYVWLHRGVYSCAQEVALQQPTLKYVNYAMEKINMLVHYGVKPYIVFDGGLLPSKMGTEKERSRKRTEALAMANDLLAAGKTTLAREHYIKACDVSPRHAYQLIKELKRQGIPYVVAPYEADAQLAYLEKHGLIDGIITEDSDLLVYGCKNVLYKLSNEGQVVHLDRDRFGECKSFRLDGWTDVEFRHMAILSGCDYLDSIRGLGLKTAHQLMRKYRNAKKVIQSIRFAAKLRVPATYEKEFRRADLTFVYQCVFDPRTQSLVHLNEPNPAELSTEDLFVFGAGLSQELARGIACGDIDPLTREPMTDIVPSCQTRLPTEATTSFYRSRDRRTKSKLSLPEKGTRDIRNFFGAAPVASKPNKTPRTKKRKVLADVSINSPPGKNKAARVALADCPKKSRFFDTTPDDAALVCFISDSDDEALLLVENEELLSTASDASPTPEMTLAEKEALRLAQLLDEEEAERAWQQSRAVPDDTIDEDILTSVADVEDLVAERDGWSDSGIQEDDMSPAVLATDGSVTPVKVKDPQQQPVSSDLCGITSPPLTPRSNGTVTDLSQTVSSPSAHVERVKSSPPLARQDLLDEATSEFSDYSEPRVTIYEPPKQAKPGEKTKRPRNSTTCKRVTNLKSAEVTDDEVEEDASISAVAASWRLQFMRNTSSKPGQPMRLRTVDANRKSLQTAVDKAVKTKKPLPRTSDPPPRAAPAKATKSRMTLPAFSIEPASTTSTTPGSTENGTPVPWQKVTITDSRLKQFQFKKR